MTTPGKILVVDDDPTIRWTLTLTLKAEGYEVQAANDGETALDRLEPVAFDLVILDVKLPGKSGIEVLREVARSKPELKVILITAYGDVTMAVDAMRLGAFNFIPKPFSPEQILEAVHEALQRQPVELFDMLFEDHRREAEEALAAADYDRALAHAQALMAYGDELPEERPDGYYYAAEAMLAKGHRQEAKKFARLALKMAPGHVGTLRLLSVMHEHV